MTISNFFDRHNTYVKERINFERPLSAKREKSVKSQKGTHSSLWKNEWMVKREAKEGKVKSIHKNVPKNTQKAAN